MKKIYVLLIIITLLLSVTACGAKPGSLSDNSDFSSQMVTSSDNDTLSTKSTNQETTSTNVSAINTQKVTTITNSRTTKHNSNTTSKPTPAPTTNAPDNNMIGNTDGNLANGGYVAFADNWIYYTNFKDEERLYKVRADGSGKTKVSDNTGCRIIQLYDGWVYYESNYNSSFRVRVNGVDTNKASLGFFNFRITTKGIWGTCKDERYGNSILRKSALDGSAVTIFSNTLWYGINHAQPFVFDEDLIYYAGMADISDEATSIGIIKKDGSGRKTLLKGEEFLDGIQKAGDWLYYTKWSGGDSIWKIRTDGSQKTVVLNKVRKSDDIAADFNIVGDNIYYIQSGKSICKSDLSGGQQTVLYTSSSNTLKSVSILNGRIYFIESLTDGKALRSVTISGRDYKTL